MVHGQGEWGSELVLRDREPVRQGVDSFVGGVQGGRELGVETRAFPTEVKVRSKAGQGRKVSLRKWGDLQWERRTVMGAQVGLSSAIPTRNPDVLFLERGVCSGNGGAGGRGGSVA